MHNARHALALRTSSIPALSARSPASPLTRLTPNTPTPTHTHFHTSAAPAAQPALQTHTVGAGTHPELLARARTPHQPSFAPFGMPVRQASDGWTPARPVVTWSGAPPATEGQVQGVLFDGPARPRVTSAQLGKGLFGFSEPPDPSTRR